MRILTPDKISREDVQALAEKLMLSKGIEGVAEMMDKVDTIGALHGAMYLESYQWSIDYDVFKKDSICKIYLELEKL